MSYVVKKKLVWSVYRLILKGRLIQKKKKITGVFLTNKIQEFIVISYEWNIFGNFSKIFNITWISNMMACEARYSDTVKVYHNPWVITILKVTDDMEAMLKM